MGRRTKIGEAYQRVKKMADRLENKRDILWQTLRAKWAIFRPHFGGLQPQTPSIHGLIKSRVMFRVT